MKSSIVLHPNFTIGTVDPRLFGSFIEHLGRAVYGGIFEPGHPMADADGFRTDVIELVKELRVPIVRYPGGNFVSGYHWEEGVGPVEERPRRLDPAWFTLESNRVGTNEFAAWARKAGVEVMMAVNLGTRGIDAARSLVEYCNHPGGSAWSDLRIRHGAREPHNIKTWCLGNEMDGPWQLGHVPAEDYGKLAAAAGRAMKWVDPGIELVACGSSSSGMPTFPAWEATVLEHTYDVVDYISLHRYLSKSGWTEGGGASMETAEFVALPLLVDSFIETVVATCDHIRARKRSKKLMMLSFDEWNVWYHSRAADANVERWSEAPPLLEDIYTFEDALVVGGMLLSLLRHCDRVRIACLAQLVNVIAPIMTVPGGPAWRQTIFHPFRDVSLLARGDVLDLRVSSPDYQAGSLGPVPTLDSAAVWKAGSGELVVFAVNRSVSMELEIDLRAFPQGLRLQEHRHLISEDPLASTSAATPGRVSPSAGGGGEFVNSTFRTRLAPLSWNVLRFGAADRSDASA